MNRVIVGIAIFLIAGALFFGGLFLGQASAMDSRVGWMMGSGFQGPRFIGEEGQPVECGYGNAAGMMGNGYGMMGSGYGMMGNGYGMMGNGYGMMGNGYGMMGNGYGMMGNGYGMMGNGYGMMGNGYGMMGNGYGMMGNAPGMMNGYRYEGRTNPEPLSIEDVETAVAEYVASLGNESLTVGEIMIFDNHAYAQIVDTGSDTGAFEVLVDPVTRNVYPEPGPNMMWNTEYGHMSGFDNYGMMGGMMGRGMMGNIATNAEISVSGEEAITVAQQYLDTYLNGTTAGETADAFPGYYTIHVLRDGEIIGMLSVNAYTGQAFLHQWHGEFLEMSGEEHD